MRKALQACAMAAAVLGAAITIGLGWTAQPAWAQGSRKDDIVFNAQGKPMAGATVRVCTANATGEPCSPLANIYSDEALTQALANPMTTDGLGNYHFYAAPGRYMIEISGPGIVTKQIPDVILPNDPSSPTFASLTTTSGISAFSLTLSGNLTVNGNASVSGTLTGGSITATALSPAGTSGDCAKWGSGGTLGDAGAPCGSGGGSGDLASANDGIQYGSKNSTAGSGLSVSTPQPYLTNMFSALSPQGGEMDIFGAYGTGSGPVTLDASCTSLYFLASGDPNYASPPPCHYESKPFSIIGRSGTLNNGFTAPATPISGCGTTAGTPCLFIAGSGHLLKSVKMQYPPVALQIGGLSDGSTGTCPATSNTFLDNFTANVGTVSSSYGPAVKIGCNTLWTEFHNVSLEANALAPSTSPDLRAAVLIDPHGVSSGAFSAFNIFDHMYTSGGGGIYLRGGASGTSSLMVDTFTEEGSGACQSPISQDPTYYGYISPIELFNAYTSDCGTAPPIADFFHDSAPQTRIVGWSGGVVNGSATLFGNVSDYGTTAVLKDLDIPVARVYPSGKNDKGLWLGHVLSDIPDLWRSGAPQLVRFAQMSGMDWNSADWNLTSMGTGVAVSAITDPWQQSGKSDAWKLSCTANGTTGCWAQVGVPTVGYSAGDYFIISALVQPASSAGLTNANLGQLALQFPYAPQPHWRFIASGGGGSVASNALVTKANTQTDGHWQRVWTIAQATNSGSVAAWITLGFDATHPIDVSAPMVVHIPAGTLPIQSPCTISALSESGDTATATTTAACPVTPGQPFIISGSSTTGWNSMDVIGTGSAAYTDATEGLFVVTSVTDATHFTFYMPTAGLSAASDGTILFTNDSEAAELARTLTDYPPSCTAGQSCNAWGPAPQLGADQTWAGTNTVTGSVTPGGAGSVTATNVTPAGASGNCVEWGSGGALTDAGSPCGTSGGDVSGPASSADGDVATFSGTTGKVLQDSGVAGSSLVSASANYTASGDLVQAAGANKTTSDSGIAAASVNTNSSAFTSGDLIKASGSHTTADSGIAASAVSQTVASGTVSLGTSAISSGTCASVVTVAATGVATTDVVTAGFDGDPTSTTGYLPSTSGMLTIIAYPTAGNVNFKVCNNTSSSITPGAVTLNWRVAR